MEIVTKFTIGNEQGINTLLFLTAALAHEQFVETIPELELEEYIDRNYNKAELMTELNRLSNQYLVVYVNGEPAGYARVTTKGTRPEFFHHRTMVRIADFGVLAKFDDPVVSQRLLEKCLSVAKMQQVIWINEFENHPYLALFESYGFKITTAITLPMDWLLPPVHLIKENN